MGLDEEVQARGARVTRYARWAPRAKFTRASTIIRNARDHRHHAPRIPARRAIARDYLLRTASMNATDTEVREWFGLAVELAEQQQGRACKCGTCLFLLALKTARVEDEKTTDTTTARRRNGR